MWINKLKEIRENQIRKEKRKSLCANNSRQQLVDEYNRLNNIYNNAIMNDQYHDALCYQIKACEMKMNAQSEELKDQCWKIDVDHPTKIKDYFKKGVNEKEIW